MFRKILYIFILVQCVFPLEACDHISEEFEEEGIVLSDSTNIVTNPNDTTQIFTNTQDSTRTSTNKPDTTQTSTTVTDTTSHKGITRDTITVAHWNIGHFALGKTSNTTIKAEDSEDMAKCYHLFLDSLNIDILGVCEYEPSFSKGGEKTKEMIFNHYPYYFIGKKNSYNCNAIFSIEELKDSKAINFSSCVQQRYFIKTTINVNDIDIIFVETHLDWNQGSNGKEYRNKQINQLVETFKDSPYVIISADYNTSSKEELQPFITAGFTMANGGDYGSFLTSPASNPRSSIDNIIVRGFKILDVEVLGDDKLSDHFLIMCNLVIMR